MGEYDFAKPSYGAQLGRCWNWKLEWKEGEGHFTSLQTSDFTLGFELGLGSAGMGKNFVSF